MSRDSDAISAVPQPGPGENPSSAAPFGIAAWVWATCALLVGVALSMWLANEQQRQLQADHRATMESMADTSQQALLERLRACQMVARAVQTLFLASNTVDADEFHNVYANLKLGQRLPGLQAMAYAERSIDATGARYPTTLIEPKTGNERLIGLDVTLQPSNFAALLASRDSDAPVLSAPFRLIQQTTPDQLADGITLRLPVYTPGSPPLTTAERRERIRGSLAISFRVGALVQSALSEQLGDRLHIRLSDVTGTPRLLFDSQPDVPFAASEGVQRTLRYGGREWLLELSMPLQAVVSVRFLHSVLWPGLLASALFALLVWSLITSRRRALELGWRMSRRYRESEERFRALNELLPALVLLARGDDGRISYANQAARLRLGGSVVDCDLASVFDDPAFVDQIGIADTATTGVTAEALLKARDGDLFWASVSIARVEVGGHGMLLMVASDISKQRQLTDLLGYQASHDALTELYNRREFERRLEHALASIAAGGAPSALLYIDLDQFKLINDTSGHIAGDQLLTHLAAIMREQLREHDVLARLGGDEFGVLVTGAHDLQAACRVAERLRTSIDGYVFMWEQSSYTISASIGGVMLDSAEVTLTELLASADTACYMAKEKGRNRVHFYSAQDDETALRHGEMEWANRLRWAVDESRLLLKYQEVVPLTTIAGAGPHIELLLRFRAEDGQLVVPGAFLPAAERYGLMPMIDRWVIQTALSNFDRLHPSGAALTLATINLSGASIEDPSLADLILQLLQRYRVDPSRVCFEITETVAVRNLTHVCRFMTRLREVGCKFALDDFGAGMSSFGYLKNLPVDIIKIDGSFIRDLLDDPMSLAIVRAVTDIGHGRGLLVVAEWVSSEALMEVLVEIGVDYAQGFSLHRPELVPFHAS